MLATEHSIQIEVHTEYLPGQAPEQSQFAFAYHIKIENQGPQEVQLLNRYWLITDGNGKNTEVKGPGVIGQQPSIAPGAQFEYSSGALLDTPVGSMQGYYEMRAQDGLVFNAPIDVFSLRVPNLVN
ncbi:MAG: Co2+/Mg2+ efflux protein ApaG [Paraglaciecola sp.]|nr:Co2+/Mg2+ efflux protein ApaG [Paraglaciecola sp.]